MEPLLFMQQALTLEFLIKDWLRNLAKDWFPNFSSTRSHIVCIADNIIINSNSYGSLMSKMSRVIVLNCFKVIDNNLDPVWNELLKFKCDENAAEMVFTVWDKNSFTSDELMCFGVAPLAGLIQNVDKEYTIPLRGQTDKILTFAINQL